jgi:uncharacterized membrane protein
MLWLLTVELAKCTIRFVVVVPFAAVALLPMPMMYVVGGCGGCCHFLLLIVVGFWHFGHLRICGTATVRGRVRITATG